MGSEGLISCRECPKLGEERGFGGLGFGAFLKGSRSRKRETSWTQKYMKEVARKSTRCWGCRTTHGSRQWAFAFRASSRGGDLSRQFTQMGAFVLMAHNLELHKQKQKRSHTLARGVQQLGENAL